MTHDEEYAALHDAVEAQRIRLYGSQRQEDPWGEAARVFRIAARRGFDGNVESIRYSVGPGGGFVGVGGGAGRVWARGETAWA